MEKGKKIILVLLIFSISLCGCSKAQLSNNGIIVTTSLKDKPVLVGNIPCTFPLVKKTESLNIMTAGYEGVKCEDVFVWNKYEEMTGVSVNWTNVTKAERGEAVATALINKHNIDLITRCRVKQSDLTQYGQSGLILDLAKDDLLKKYAPNCWAYLQSHPETLASIMNPDGSIYALPQVNSGAELRVSRKVYFNKIWLQNINMTVPKTTEEFYQVLKAFKEQDANGNGDPNDEIPLCSYDWDSIQDALFGAFGLGNRGVHNQLVDCDETTGQVRLIAASDDYKDYLIYLNKLYIEGLLDNQIFNTNMNQWFHNANQDMIGTFPHTNLGGLPADKTDNWVALEEALEGPNGDKLWAPIRANFHSCGNAIIPATCQKPELVLQWLDYFWTDEGTLFYHMGVEGETFVVNEDGSYDYMPKIYAEMKSENISFDDVVARYTPYPGGGNPTVEVAPYFLGGEMAPIPSSAARALFNYGPKEYWPSFTFTTDENERLDAIQSDLEKYCSAMLIEFVSGTRSFDEWDDYLAQLDKMGTNELLQIYQAAVDRYHE